MPCSAMTETASFVISLATIYLSNILSFQIGTILGYHEQQC